MNCEAKHALHCAALLTWILGFAYFCGVFTEPQIPITSSPFESRETYAGTSCQYHISNIRCSPDVMFMGWCQPRSTMLVAAFCIVMRGNAVTLDLWQMSICLKPTGDENIATNMKTCYDAGMENFIFEVVADNAIHLPPQPRVRKVVVPTSYRTKSGAKFKALLYNIVLKTMSISSRSRVIVLQICGILNFCEDGRHQFGQGVITYASGEFVNWLTTMSDSRYGFHVFLPTIIRLCETSQTNHLSFLKVADDMGQLRLHFKLFHKPLFGWKGSFFVTPVDVK
ncbi:unnamed protein product [Cylicocyclus nassatus]|uniref:Uncharacterized protein n=1 Tax=Cylicocyclus nassatus TaxID=53992 RepID=A0AA36H3D7_CYLNA|nr:unnamed protein product [Cylicocyclus nassatus]